MTHRCNRCRAEYESGGFYNGMDYCANCFQFVKQKDDIKRREEAERQQKMIEEKRELMRDRLIRESERKRKDEMQELKRRRVAEEMKRREILKLERDAQAQKKQKRHELMHQRTFGKPVSQNFSFSGSGSAYEGNGIIPLDQQRQAKKWSAARAEKSDQEENKPQKKNNPYEFRLDMREDAQPRPFSLLVEKGLPDEIEAGKTVRVTLVGKNMRQKKEEALMVAFLKLEDGSKIALESEPKECFLEPGGEGRFEIAVAPGKAASGSLVVEVYLKDSAYYIDPEQGKSETLQLLAKIKLGKN